MSACYYVSIGAQTFGVTHAIPVFISTVLTVFSTVTHDVLFLLYGLFILLLKWVIWCIQVNLQMVRPLPVCAVYETYAFPSLPVVVSVSLVVFALCYSYYWRVPVGWIATFFLWCIFLGPSAVMYVYDYNRGWEIVLSMVIGVISTWMFMIFMHDFIASSIPYLQFSFPLWHLGYRMYYMEEEDNRYARQYKELEQCWTRFEESSGRNTTDAARQLGRRG